MKSPPCPKRSPWAAAIAALLLCIPAPVRAADLRLLTDYVSVPIDRPTGVADFNGDGAADFCAWLGTGAGNISLAIGNGAFAPTHEVDFGGTCEPAFEDVNLDGRLDAVTAGAGSSGAAIFMALGNGDGSFQPPVEFPTVDGACRVLVADVVEDGAPDVIAVGGTSSPWLAIHPGRGDGTFGARIDLPTALYVFGAVPGDFNRDGHVDLALTGITVGNSHLYDAYILLGNGQGAFTFVQSMTYNDFFSLAAQLVVVDADGDGIQDLLTPNHAGMGVFPGRSSPAGTFEAGRQIALDQGLDFITPADLDGDGHSELIASGLDAVQVLEVSGGFAVGQGPLVAYRFRAIGTGDADGDGHTDVYGRTFTGEGAWLRGNGDRTIGVPTHYPVKDVREVAFGDLNQDGRVDLVATLDADSILIMDGLGDGRFANPVRYAAGIGPGPVEIADLDGDGRLEIVVANGVRGNRDTAPPQDFGSSITILRKDGVGGLDSVEFPTGVGPTDFAIGDVNGDGRPDLAVVEGGRRDSLGSSAIVMLNSGAPYPNLFLPPARYPLSSPDPMWVGIADVNVDSNPDLIVASRGAPVPVTGVDYAMIRTLRGLGDGTFYTGAGLVTRLPAPPRYVAFGRIDGDAYPDIVLGHDNVDGTVPENTIVLTGDSRGFFHPWKDLLAGSYPMRPAAIADLDLDGVPDIVTDGGASVDVYLGSETWDRPPAKFGGGPAARCVRVADVNGDDRPDVVFAGWTPFRRDEIYIALNQTDVPTPIRPSLLDVTVLDDRIRIRWFAPGPVTGAVERTSDGQAWDVVGFATRIGDLLAWEDRDVIPGGRYGYRLRLSRNGGTVEPAWVEVPAAPGLTISWVSGSSAHDPLEAEVQLASAASATIDLFDVGGRRMAHRKLDGLGPGRHRVMLAAPGGLPCGLYLARLVQGAESVSGKAIVLR